MQRAGINPVQMQSKFFATGGTMVAKWRAGSVPRQVQRNKQKQFFILSLGTIHH